MKRDSASPAKIKPPERRYLHERIIVVALAGVFVVMSFASDNFLSFQNLTAMTRNFIEPGLLALAMTFIILEGDIDLSVGSTLALTSVVMAMVNEATGNIFLAVGVCVVLGLACGAFNGLLVGYAKLPSFIATLSTMFLYHGIALGVSKAETIGDFPAGMHFIGQGSIAGVPTQLWLFALCAAVLVFVLQRTRHGRYTRVVGFNPSSAEFSGINTAMVRLKNFTLAGFMSALAAIVLVGRVSAAKATLGTGYELDAITTVVLGGTSISGGYGSVTGTVVGIFLVGMIKNGLTLARVPSEVTTIVVGMLLLLSIILSGNANRLAKLFKREGAKK